MCRLTGGFNYAALRRFRRSADGTRARIASFSIFNSQFLNRSIMRSTKDFLPPEAAIPRRKPAYRVPARNPEPILHRTRLCRLHDRCIADFLAVAHALQLLSLAGQQIRRHGILRRERHGPVSPPNTRAFAIVSPALCSVTSLYCAKPALSISMWSFQSFGSLSVTAMMVRRCARPPRPDTALPPA